MFIKIRCPKFKWTADDTAHLNQLNNSLITQEVFLNIQMNFSRSTIQLCCKIRFNDVATINPNQPAVIKE